MLYDQSHSMDPDKLECVFKKTLSNTDINERLAYPVSLINRIWVPNDTRGIIDFRVVDRFREGWEFRAHMRWDQRGHPKPKVYGPEWKRFVKAKQLKAGDELFFYRHPDPAPSNVVFVVSIKRSITLWGKQVSGHISA